MKRSAEFDVDSLIEDIQLMNCFGGEDELRILNECYEVQFKLNELEFKEINEILKKTYLRYKRYIKHINLEQYIEIEKNIYKFLQKYKKETDITNWFNKYRELLEIMIEIDKMILNELNDSISNKSIKKYKK